MFDGVWPASIGTSAAKFGLYLYPVVDKIHGGLMMGCHGGL